METWKLSKHGNWATIFFIVNNSILYVTGLQAKTSEGLSKSGSLYIRNDLRVVNSLEVLRTFHQLCDHSDVDT